MTDTLPIKLSVLDTAPVWRGSTATESLRSSVRLAQAVDRLGYHRFWVAEHHNMPALATSSPAVLAGRVAAATRRLRVGAGGVMLPNHPPLVVAEQFGTLAALHPGRIDLGLGRAPGTDPVTARALRRRAGALGAEDFPAQVRELTDYFARTSADRPLAVPAEEQNVPVWLLGSSPGGARLAADLGLPFAFAHHFSPFGAADALDAYRTAFRPSAHLSEPYALVSVFGAVAEDDRRGRLLDAPLRMINAQAMRGLDPLFPSVEEAAAFRFSPQERSTVDGLYDAQFFGGPETVRQKLTAFVRATGADELMVLSPVRDHDERVRSYRLLAELTGLKPSGRS
ncbi:LLM class flavin-dependent oxidoreductase [Streptomyces sp. NPDC001020]